MIIINEFKLSDDLASITLSIASDFDYDYVRIYVGNNYLTNQYYDVPIPKPNVIDSNGRIAIDTVIYASQLSESAPLTDIYILSIKDEKNNKSEAGIWSLEAPSQCLSNMVLNYPNDCGDCKGITAINIMYMNMEATIMFLASYDFVKALETLDTVKLMCPSYGDFSIAPEGACPGGIGCWIIEDDFIVQ